MKYLARTVIITTLGLSLIAGSPAMAVGLTATQQERLTVIKQKGDEEIARRTTSLSKLSSILQSAKKLSTADKATLTAEVASATDGLTALKTQLDNETTLDGARTDVQSIVSEYRVFALVMPKVHLIKIADDQIAAETALSSAATKLQARVSGLQSSGKDVSSLLTPLADMKAKIANAQKISMSVQASVINLQPTDYNSDHKILEGDNTQLKTAHADLVKARQDADVIVKGIAAL